MPSHIHSARRLYRIASIPGDGIGVEVTASALRVLSTLADACGTFSLDVTTLDWSSAKYLERGYYMPPDGIQSLRDYEAIWFGAVGHPAVKDHVSLWELILPLRKELNQFVNVRPASIIPGTTSPLTSLASNPAHLDWLIIRENSEGEYAGQGGISHAGTPFATGTEVAIFTRPALERIFRFAFDAAIKRPRKKLTMVTKSNAQRYGMVLWDQVFEDVCGEYRDSGVAVDKMLVDAMTVRMVNRPESLDTIVATNLHADILTDLAAALAGSIGIAPSSNLDPTRANPSMFEPIHGSAPDIAGKGVANPLGAIWSAAEMLRWLGEGGQGVGQGVGAREAADVLIEAMGNVCLAGVKTKDLGGQSGTDEVTEAVCREVEKLVRGRA